MSIPQKENKKKDSFKKEENQNQNKNSKKEENQKQDSDFFASLFFTIGNLFLDFFMAVGIMFRRSFSKIRRKYRKFYYEHLKYYSYRNSKRIKKIFAFFKKLSRKIRKNIFLFVKFHVDAYRVVAKGFNKNKGKFILIRIKDAFLAFCRGLANNTFIFKTFFNYALPVASIIGFVFLVKYTSNINFAVSVQYNGEHVGYIQDESVFEKAEANLQSRMTYLENDEIIDDLPAFSIAIVENSLMKSDIQLTDAMIQSSSADIVQAIGLTIDNRFYGAVKNAEPIKEKLNQKLEAYRTNDKTERVRFTKDVQLVSGMYIAQNVVDTQKLIDVVDKVEDKDIYYTVKEGDTPIIIAATNDISLDELVALNPGILESCPIGKQVLVNKSQPFLPVSTIKTVNYEQKIPYQTEYSNSSKYRKGDEKITQEGKDGVEAVVAEVEEVDGIEISRTIISRDIISEAVTQKVIRGTAVYYESNEKYSGVESSSGFIWPSYGGYISSPFGWRSFGWGRDYHTGIDYATAHGTPISAAAGGKVVFSGRNGTYGYMVKIDHGGGIQTWYAHASKLYVKSGQVVEQGQKIAAVGSTGRSSGNHVHVEFRVNGVAKNPRNYLP